MTINLLFKKSLKGSIMLWLIFSLFFTQCVLLGGSDTETANKNDENTIMGIVYNESGEIAPGAWISIMPSDFVPNETNRFQFQIQSDSMGEYKFEGLDVDQSYNIAASLNQSNLVALEKNIVPSKDAYNINLNKPLRLEITLEYVDYAYEKLDSTHTYFPGTNIWARCDSFTVIDSLPSGAASMVFNNSKEERALFLIPNQKESFGPVVNADPGDTLRIKVLKYFGQAYQLDSIE